MEISLTVAIDARMVYNSGIGRYIREVLSFLLQNQMIKKVYFLGTRDEYNQIPIHQKMHFIPLKSKIFTIYEQIELPLKIPACDIFWSPQYNIPIFVIWAKKRVVTIHDVYQLAYFYELSFVKKMYVKTVLNCSVIFSDKIITVSQFSKNEILKYTIAKTDKINVIYNGLSSSFKEKMSDKNTLDIKTSYFLYVGNVKPHKNLKKLLNAYKLFLESNKEYKLIIVGQKEGFLTGENNIEKEIEGYEEFIVFTGYVNDDALKRYYAGASLFIFPSLYEGFGYPVLEAMSFNRKIIASKAASIPEVGEDAIIYFNPYDINDIASAIQKGLQQTNQDYSKQLEKFSLEKMQENYNQFFQSIKNDIANK